ncbi:MAG: hypothetical protein A3F74_22105 [Betaproteobacteria bacterium RIFCSPLOWO2_12_FULL_62_58]|nr:MAG: hypothetical protein A3F74_22105 [Betaproteobacteria bacterium RIFCSPLOWO2_12_FULL_62_58]
MTKRRKLLLALGLVPFSSPIAAFAQSPGKVARVGFFYFASRQSALDSGRYQSFLQGMRELGYVEGKTFVVISRFGEGKTDALAGLAADLIKESPNVIVATGTPVYHVLQKSTKTIPIVITVSPDPVGDGLAASFARPGGNFTGLTNFQPELNPKQVELLTASVSKVSRLAVLSHPANSTHPEQLKLIEATAHKIGIQVLSTQGGTPDDIVRSFEAMARDGAQALLILGDGFFLQQIKQLGELALKFRLPSIALNLEYLEAGGLMTYGPNITDNFRRAAVYVDKILKGAKPGDLPIERPTTFELGINMKTAKALGVTIPKELLLRAEKVIE